jgi:hypothetical protein
MERILMVLAVAALLVAMAAYTVAPAFAAQCPGNPHCENPGGQPHGANQHFVNPSGK